jgi:hypothetical protein
MICSIGKFFTTDNLHKLRKIASMFGIEEDKAPTMLQALEDIRDHGLTMSKEMIVNIAEHTLRM